MSESTRNEAPRSLPQRMGSALAWPLIALVRLYQVTISPLRPPTCRFYPSCSSYALTSLRRFGPIRGTYLMVHRLLRCHPWNPGGIDHVPDTWDQRGAPELSQVRLASTPDPKRKALS